MVEPETAMAEAVFWRLIDETRRDDPFAHETELAHALAARSLEDIWLFGELWRDIRQRAYRWDLWNAAFLINLACGDDGFKYFRNWLILQGRDVYERAVADPDSLADVVPDEEFDGEQGCQYEIYPEQRAWEEAAGHDDPDGYVAWTREMSASLGSGASTAERRREPEGDRWDPEDQTEARRRLPRLSARFLGRTPQWLNDWEASHSRTDPQAT